MIKDYFLLAFGNLRHRGLRSWLTMLGIFIGIAAVVSLITMGQGLQEAITGQLGSLSIDRLTIQNKQTGFAPPGAAVVEKLDEDDLKIVEGINGIDKVVTRLIRVGSLTYNDISGFGFAVDLPNTDEGADFIYESFNLKAEEGRLLKSDDRGKILLGHRFLKTEDFEKDFRVGAKLKLNDKDFEIVGFLEQSSSFQINSLVMVTNQDLEDLLNIEKEYDLIIVKVQDKDDLEQIAEEIERKLRKERDEKIGEESFTVETPIQSLSTVNDVLNVVNIIVVGIAMISLFVGGVGIANTMYTSIVERTREIGIMKAIGAKNSDVLMIFLFESGLLGLVGGTIGVAIGILLGEGAEYIGKVVIGTNLLQASFPWYLIVGSLVFSFLIGTMSGVFPAYQASKLKPADALRYE